mgnify:FL=1
MPNNIETVTLFQQACDQQLIEGATSGWMEANAGQVKYSGGRDIKIPTLSTDGLGDYDRNNGYPRGKVSLAYQTKTMTMDRGIQFLLDRIDVDESGFIANAAAAMSTFQSENVIPEIDAYRYSKLYKLVNDAGYAKSYTPAASTIMSALKNDITAIRDKCGTADLVIMMPYTVADILDSTDKLQRQINVGTFRQGSVDLAVKTFNGSPIIRVPSERMYSEYTFNDGKAGFGFTKTETAKLINWIICPRNAPIAVSKTDGVKIFDPATTQGADAWTIEYRKFHDLWVKDNRLPAMRVSVAE